MSAGLILTVGPIPDTVIGICTFLLHPSAEVISTVYKVELIGVAIGLPIVGSVKSVIGSQLKLNGPRLIGPFTFS